MDACMDGWMDGWIYACMYVLCVFMGIDEVIACK